VAHPSLRELDFSGNVVAPALAACVGTALFALVAANTPVLQKLDVSRLHLGDAGLALLMHSLPRNTHLRTLHMEGNIMSDVFARDVLLPAVLANTSLTELVTFSFNAGAVEAQAIVARRAAAHS
jgi:hypothetical protein